jgi:hypothetical protein
VRKILSIVIALGMVLALSAIAVPAAAGTFPPCGASVGSTSFCAGATATYTINFTADHTLLPVNDKISVDFAPGTSLAAVTKTDVTVNGTAVTSVAISGTHIEFPIPAAMGIINVGDPVTVVIGKVVNPATAGATSLVLDVNLLCCGPFDFDCGNYTILPAYSTYGCVWDSSATYDGIAQGFVPPFKACGQEDFPGLNLTGKHANLFNLFIKPTVIGCAGPCTTAMNLTLNVTAAPAGSNVTISINGTTFYPVTGTAIVVEGPYTLGANTTINISGAVHFDTVGDYTLCFEMICPAGTPSCLTDPPCVSGPASVFECCSDFSVYQWKTAEKIDLFRKWNLISLPLVPLEEDMPIEDVLAPLPNWSTLVKGIYSYDCASGAWDVWGNGQTSLDTLEDGKAYWVKIDYVLGSATKGPGLPVGGLWVFGTPKPVPPNSPSAYPVCAGWNMVGLTGFDDGTTPPTPALGSTTEGAYFWNWWAPGPTAMYGAIFGWTPTTQTWWSQTPAQGNTLPRLQTGEGYWMSFLSAGFVYPP